MVTLETMVKPEAVVTTMVKGAKMVPRVVVVAVVAVVEVVEIETSINSNRKVRVKPVVVEVDAEAITNRVDEASTSSKVVEAVNVVSARLTPAK